MGIKKTLKSLANTVADSNPLTNVMGGAMSMYQKIKGANSRDKMVDEAAVRDINKGPRMNPRVSNLAMMGGQEAADTVFAKKKSIKDKISKKLGY